MGLRDHVRPVIDKTTLCDRIRPVSDRVAGKSAPPLVQARHCRGPLSCRRFEIHTQASTVPSPLCFERTPGLEAENCQEEETTPNPRTATSTETHDSSTTDPSLWDFIAGSWVVLFDAKPHSCALDSFFFLLLSFHHRRKSDFVATPRNFPRRLFDFCSSLALSRPRRTAATACTRQWPLCPKP